MLVIRPIKIKSKALAATGVIINCGDCCVHTATIPVAPAGGWVVFVASMAAMLREHPKAVDHHVNPKRWQMITPIVAEITCPKNTFLGWAKGTSGTP